MALTAASVRRELRRYANPEKAAFFPSFFKTGKGEYGEGEKFIGVIVPDQRRVAKEFRDLPLAQVAKLLDDKLHECRLTAVFILVMQFQRANEERQSELVDFLLDHLDAINNWDLVDSVAPKLLGVWMLDHPRTVLTELANSGQLWRERMSVIACFPLIKNGEFREIKKFAKQFLTHEHDLIHKAVGWMLREMGKQDEAELCKFLDRHVNKMPRTMLRYAIERLSPKQRKGYLGK